MYSANNVFKVHTEKSYRNIKKSNRNQIGFRFEIQYYITYYIFFRVIWNQTDVRLVPNQSANSKYNLNSVWFIKISKRFLLCTGPQPKKILNCHSIFIEGVLNAINYHIFMCIKYTYNHLLYKPSQNWLINLFFNTFFYQ